MIDLKPYQVWFVTGSQHLYGKKALDQVGENAKQIVQGLAQSPDIPVQVVYKPIVTTPEEIYNLVLEANNSENCIGLILWMHTFSPAKMWAAGSRHSRSPSCICIPNSIATFPGRRLIWIS